MRLSPAQKRPRAEGGFVMIEVLVSALILVLASAGVATVLATAVHTSGEQRHSSEAYALAQEDQSRLSSMPLPTLNHLVQEREIPLNGMTFTVHSYGLFINNKTSTPSCGKETASADYVQITSVVTWPGMSNSEKAKIESILSPSGTTSLDPTHGTLAISVANENLEPIPGVELVGQQTEGGSGSFVGETDAEGCALFPDLPTTTAGKAAPNYTVTVNGERAGVINKDGKSTETTTGAVSIEHVEILPLRFDHPGTVPVQFDYRVGSTSAFEPAKADSVVAYNTGMTSAKTIWTESGAREATVNAAPLFPFKSTYAIYAGSCSANNPNPYGETNPAGAAAIAYAAAPAGGTAAPATIQLPALNLTVTDGGVPFAGARVTVTDKVCTDAGGAKVKRVYTTNAAGKQSETTNGVAEPGLPWGRYELCVSGEVSAGESRRVRVWTVYVENLTSGTTEAVDLSGGESGGTCP